MNLLSVAEPSLNSRMAQLFRIKVQKHKKFPERFSSIISLEQFTISLNHLVREGNNWEFLASFGSEKQEL